MAGGSAIAAETLAAALEREHHEIDDGIEAFLASPGDERSGIEALERTMRALRRHIYLEEEILFPPLRDGGLVAPIFVMLREHGEIWDTMTAIEARLGAGDGSGAAEGCRQLLAQLELHNTKEEPIVYPQADSALSAEADTKLRTFLAEGRLPDGWSCERASA